MYLAPTLSATLLGLPMVHKKPTDLVFVLEPVKDGDNCTSIYSKVQT